MIGGLDVRVNRNHFGRQVESFQSPINLPFLTDRPNSGAEKRFQGVFIRAPVVEKVLPNLAGIQSEEDMKEETIVAPSKQAADDVAKAAMSEEVEVLATLPGRAAKAATRGIGVDAKDEVGNIIAVRQGNVVGMSFHPELTTDARIHEWWLRQVLESVLSRRRVTTDM